MADNRCPHHPSLLPLSSDDDSLRSHSSPPEFFCLLPAISQGKSSRNGSLSDSLFSGGNLLPPLSFLGNARSLDYRRLRGHRESNHHSGEAADCGCGTGAASWASREGPKWYRVLTLGVARVSQKMELEDMRKRQIGRCPAEEEGGRREKRRNAAWKVMSTLSCNGFASVAVSPSIACVPPHPS